FLKAHAAEQPQVVICSAGAAVVRPGQDGPPDLTQSVLSAMTKAVIAEYPDIKCVQVDLDPTAPTLAVGLVLERVAALAGTGHLALRGGLWYEARVRERELPGVAPASAVVRPDGTYFVTGGLGGLGLAVASWLVDQGARALLLVGRGVPVEE